MRNEGPGGPIRHRLSELPATTELDAAAGGSAAPGVTGGAASGRGSLVAPRAAALLGSLPRPAELSPAAMVRVRERIAALGAEGVARPWWQWAAASTAAIGAATMAAILLPRLSAPRPPAELTVRELRLPDSGVARLRTGPGSELLLGGPGALALPVGGSPITQLLAGRLAVQAGSEDVVIDAAGQRVTVPKGHMAEVVVHLGELVRIAAYVGESSLLDRGEPLRVRQGTVWTRDGERALAVECRGLVAAALAGGPWPSPEACGGAASPRVTAIAVAPAAVPASAEREPGSVGSVVAPLHPAVRPAPRVVRLSAAANPALGMAAGPGPGAVKGALVGSAVGGATSGLAEESRLLGVALHQLHQERDGGAALRSLDSYQQRFPKGLLSEEAQAARVDALLLGDHRSEALALLEETQFQRLGRGGELRVVRAELRATAGRCREALADFAAVLQSSAAPAPPPVAERALYGQAGCYAQLAETQHARAALEQYLTRFPTGRFAEAARRSLQTLP